MKQIYLLIRKERNKMKERQFTEDICKVLVHEEPEVVFGLLEKAGIKVNVDSDNIFDIIHKIRGLSK